MFKYIWIEHINASDYYSFGVFWKLKMKFPHSCA